ncbi:MAG: DUF2955 domain-containing protein [Desulfuromusa sp.]|nr:DUF2955 domain-containing protein [Desulfuromusa sp.]
MTPSSSWRDDLRYVRVIRLAVATTVTMAIAQIFNWPLQYVAPVLVVVLLEMPIPEPSLRNFVEYLGYAIISITGGFLFVMLLEPYPLVFIPAYLLAIFICGYTMHKGGPFVLILLIFLTLLIFPLVGNIDEGITAYLALCLLQSEILAIVIIQLAHGILPDPPGSGADASPEYQIGYSAHSAQAAAVTAITMVIAMTIFLTFNWTLEVVTMIFIGLLALEGSYAHSLYDAKKYLIANAIAGISAMVIYLVIVAVPRPSVFFLLFLFVSLMLASKRFSSSPSAKYYGSALIGVTIIITNSIGPGTDVDVTIIKRIFHIFLASVYVLGAISIIEPLLKRWAQRKTADTRLPVLKKNHV